LTALLDTNAVIAILKERPPMVADRFYAEVGRGRTILVPTVVLFELEYGIARSRRAEEARRGLDALLASPVQVVPLDAADAAEAGAIRGRLADAGTPIGPYDVLIAAQARRRGALLVTANRREFARVPGLAVADWSD